MNFQPFPTSLKRVIQTSFLKVDSETRGVKEGVGNTMAMKQKPSRVAGVRMQPNSIMDHWGTRVQAVTWLSHPTLYYQSSQSLDKSAEEGRKCPGISNSAYCGF